GYVGAVSSACLAKQGHIVIGVDPQSSKVDLINNGMPPIIEAGLDELIHEMAAARRLRATGNTGAAVAESDISLVCVGTPSRHNGSLDLASVGRVCEDIGAALRGRRDFHVVVIRSTVLPGTMRKLVVPTLERASGKTAGADFGVAVNPEFLREGSAISDFLNPPKTVIGALDERSQEIVSAIYSHLPAPLIRTSIEVAELIKYVDNSWHALKVAFGNEIGNICKQLQIDSHRVMDIFCEDTKLNISPCYLRPGFAFGGSCLPKDLRALTYEARRNDLSLPVLESILPSNYAQIERAVRLVAAKKRRRIGVLGFSFKAGTDDLRESPMVELIERLVGKGYDIRLYDRNVHLAQLVGANRQYILNTIPHLAKLMASSVEEVLDHAELVLIGTSDPGYRDALSRLSPQQAIIDMVRLPDCDGFSEQYDGINW
ncbi:MAG: nucleotide sugar dehydrogenase, partial [Stellaceae bacterium]